MASTEIMTMVKDYLHITYTPDDSSERRLNNEVADGIRFIQTYCDSSATCEPGTAYSGLLCEYVMRAEAGALATFEADFRKDIIGGRLGTEVNAYAEAVGYVETDTENG